MEFDEIVVAAHDGAIESDSIRKPLHMLPVGGKAGWSVQFDELPKLIVRMYCDSGIVGLGEFYRDHDWSTVFEIAQSLLGKQLQSLNHHNLPIPLCREYDGFECAIWDAMAKSLGVPLHFMLGGLQREKVLIGAWSSHRRANEVGAIAGDFFKQGFRCIKFKSDLDDDVVSWCEQIRETAPGMQVIFDPNERWENSAAARPLLRALERVGNVLLIEDPLPKWMYQEYRELRNSSSVPIVQHISLPYVCQGQRVHDAINCLQHRSVDGFNFNGGLARFAQLDGIASAANLHCWHGSEVDLGILEAMYVHQAAAARSCVWPSDIFGRLIRSHDLLKTPLEIYPPYVSVPSGPGLGVELDEEFVAEISKRHETVE